MSLILLANRVKFNVRNLPGRSTPRRVKLPELTVFQRCGTIEEEENIEKEGEKGIEP